MELQTFVVRDEGEQTCRRVTLAYESAFACIQLPCGETEAFTATACHHKRVCCYIERRPPMSGERVEAHRRLGRARDHMRSLRPVAAGGIGRCPRSAADNYESSQRQ
jgi:hypothetical protein